MLHLHHIAVGPGQAVVHLELVGLQGLREAAQAERPGIPDELRRAAPGIAPGIGGIVPGPVAHEGPVEELGAGIVGVGVGVKHVHHAELAGMEHQAAGAAGAAQLVGIRLHLRGLAAKVEGLPQPDAGHRGPELGVAHPVGLAVGGAGQAQDAADALAGRALGVQVELRALPGAPAGHEGGREGGRRLPGRAERVGPLVGRGEAAVALGDGRGLAVEAPGLRGGVAGLAPERRRGQQEEGREPPTGERASQ